MVIFKNHFGIMLVIDMYILKKYDEKLAEWPIWYCSH